jgi:hypothetical protein
MVEYGGGIQNGPAGQVGGGGGAASSNQAPDVLATITHGLGDLVNQVLSLPTETLVIGIVVVFLGIIVLRRAF